jgi:methenyltetrahydrofolate cyclohydrolase
MSQSIAAMPLSDLLGAIAAKTPTPGGGATAAAAALAAAQAQMVVAYSVGKKSLAAHEPALREALGVLARAREVALRLGDEDAAAYGLVNQLSRLPEGDPARAALPAAQQASVDVPLALAATCTDVLRHLETLAGITNRQLRSDLAIAAILADAAARCSAWNVAVNAGFLPAGGDQARARCDALLADAQRLRLAVERLCGETP